MVYLNLFMKNVSIYFVGMIYARDESRVEPVFKQHHYAIILFMSYIGMLFVFKWLLLSILVKVLRSVER